MQFYFGKNPQNQEGFVPQNTTDTFDYVVEYSGGEDFVITDTVGRSLPIHVSDLYSLMNVLASISQKQPALAAAREVQNPNHQETL